MLFDARGDYEDMPGWSEVADQLFDAGMTLNPSELHGAVTGLIAAGVDSGDGMTAHLESALAITLHGALVDLCDRLVRATVSAVADADFAFAPLLPDDDDAMEQRLLSLGGWVTGFLTGFTQGVAVLEQQSEAVPPETAEVMRDFAAIAQVETEAAEDDEAWRDLEELTEYVRFAALNVVQNTINQKEANV